MQKRIEKVTMRLTKKELEIIKKQAENTHLPISTYIRYKTMKEEKKG